MTDPDPAIAFHVELRRFPHVARAFNLSRAELERRIVAPWADGRPVALDDRSFSPDRARLTIYEGPLLDSGEIGLGRGWANATRAGREVTADVLVDAQRRTAAAVAASSLEQFKEALLARCAWAPLAVRDVLVLVGERNPGALLSERVALAERAVWELLHQGRVRMRAAGGVVAAEQWRATLLALETWVTPGVAIERLDPQPVRASP